MASIEYLQKQSMPFYLFYIFFFCLIFITFNPTEANNRFYISNIRVDMKDTSAAQARLKAIAQGQRKAFKILVEQLLSPEDQVSLTPPTENQLNDMIQDFEVQNEKNSEVRYIGTFAFQFYPIKVQEFLKQKEKIVLPTDINEKILVLPIFERGKKIFLWQEDNPWHQAWNQAVDLKSQYILPLGDLTDILDFPKGIALKKDFKHLQILRERYQGGYILLAILKQKNPFELSLFLYDNEGLSYSEEGLPLLGDITLTPALIQKALNKTTELIDKFSIEHKLEEATEKQSFDARVFFQNRQEWSKIQKILSTTALMRSFDVVSLQRRQAVIRLHHIGSEKHIFQALEKQGFQVSVVKKKAASKGVELRLEHKAELTDKQDRLSLEYFKEKNKIPFDEKIKEVDETLETEF